MSAWGALLRLARRDAQRAKGRSTLICLMIALPVFAMTFADVLARTAQPDADEVVRRTLGAAQYVLTAEQPIGTGLLQAPDPTESTTATGAAAGSRPVFADLGALVPGGSRGLTASSTTVEVTTRDGRFDVSWHEVAAADPAFAGRFDLLSGRAPVRPGEALATPEFLRRTGIDLGDTVEVAEHAATVAVVGTVRQFGARGDVSAVYALPGTLVGAPGGIPAAETRQSVYVVGAPPLSWRRVQALNRQGVSVYDRTLVLNPPPRAAVPYYRVAGGGGDDDDLLLAMLAAALIGGLAVLEVVLLAGAAFAVGARRQAHVLALLAAAGANARQIRAVVLAGGLVLGSVAAAVGVAGGILVAALARPLLEQLEFARFDVRPLELLAVACVALVAGVLAAVAPARAAARQDVVAALAGRRGQVSGAHRTSVVGVVLAATGVAAATGGSLWTAARESGGGVGAGEDVFVTALIAGGAGLAVVGLVVLSPSVMGLVARLGRWLPLAPRLVARDAARHRGRSAPAMSAVLVSVAGSAALLLVLAATASHERKVYVPSLPPGTGGVSLIEYVQRGVHDQEPRPVVRSAERIVRAVKPYLPVRDSVVVTQLADCHAVGCRSATISVPAKNRCPEADSAAARRDWRCRDRDTLPQPVLYASLGDDLVGDAALLRRLYGVEDPRARAVLARGGVVAFDRALVVDDHVAVDISAYDASEHDGVEPKPAETVRLPAVYVDDGDAPEHGTLLSRAAAERMGLDIAPSFLVFVLDRLPTQDEEDAAAAALAATGIDNALTVERGYTSDYGLGLLALIFASGLVTVGAAGIATGLAQADASADQSTLAAIGADPRLRRTLSALQALLIAGLGTVLGIAVSFVPAAAVIGAIDTLDLVVPWAPLLGLCVGIPLLASGAAGLCTLSRLPLVRRPPT